MTRLKNSTCGAYAAKPLASCAPRAGTDCAATTETSHPPLMPSASVGFTALMVMMVKMLYVSVAQRRIPKNQRPLISELPTRVFRRLIAYCQRYDDTKVIRGHKVI